MADQDFTADEQKKLTDYAGEVLTLGDKPRVIFLLEMCKKNPAKFGKLTEARKLTGLVAKIDDALEWMKQDENTIAINGKQGSSLGVGPYKLHAVVIQVIGVEVTDEVCFKFKKKSKKVDGTPFAKCKQLEGTLDVNCCNKCALEGKPNDCTLVAAADKTRLEKRKLQKVADKKDLIGAKEFSEIKDPVERADKKIAAIETLGGNVLTDCRLALAAEVKPFEIKKLLKKLDGQLDVLKEEIEEVDGEVEQKREEEKSRKKPKKHVVAEAAAPKKSRGGQGKTT